MSSYQASRTPTPHTPPHTHMHKYPDAISEILIIVGDVLEVNFDGGAILFIHHLDNVFILARLVACAGRRTFLIVALLVSAKATRCQTPPMASFVVGLVSVLTTSQVRVRGCVLV